MLAPLRGCLTMALLMLNLFFWGTLVLILGLPKLLMPKGELRRRWILLLELTALRMEADGQKPGGKFLRIPMVVGQGF